jgi:hypothetical protein
MAALGIYYADKSTFIGDCFCVFDNGGNINVSGILRGFAVSGILADSKFDVKLDTLIVSGDKLVAENSKVEYLLQLAAADSKCLDLSFTGLYAEDPDPSNLGSEQRALLVANGYVAPIRPGDAIALLKATSVVVQTLGNVLVQESGTWRLEWDNQEPEKAKWNSGYDVYPHTKVGSLGERQWEKMGEWDLQVWATDDNSVGVVLSPSSEVLLVGQIPGKKPLEKAAWDVTNQANYHLVNVGTALSNGLDKHALFIGEYFGADVYYVVDPKDSPIEAEMTSGSMVIPPPDWMEQASQDLKKKGIEGFAVEPIVDSVEMRVGYKYELVAGLTPKGITIVAHNNKMEVRDERASYTLSLKGKIDAFPSESKPGPGPPGPGPSGGGGGGGGGGDNTGLMVALLLGLLAYALMK